MLAARGIAEADHLDSFFRMENSVLATIAGDIVPFGVQELGRGLRAAGGQKKQEERGVFHAAIICWLRLMRG